MDTYSLLREFADSWFLLGMFGFFLSAVIWAFLPSQKSARDEAASIPFKTDTAGCANNCPDCSCTYDFLKEAQDG